MTIVEVAKYEKWIVHHAHNSWKKYSEDAIKNCSKNQIRHKFRGKILFVFI